MKKALLLLLLTFPALLIYGQQILFLDSCYAWARNNYPNLRQMGIWNDIAALQKENIRTGKLPQVAVYGQATFQSDVTGIDIPLPGIAIPRPPRDQYKAYAEIRQSVWDGGISSASAQLEDALLLNHLNQLEVELFKLHDQIAQAFFTILIAEKQLDVLHAQKLTLEERLKVATSGIKHGSAERTPALLIRAEILNLAQNELQMESVKQSAIQMLSVLTGKPIDSSDHFNYNELQINEGDNFNRPELDLFQSQRQQFDTQMNLLDKSRNPKIFSFGQTGYGRPGLNMLSDQFDSYYLLGAGITFNPFDWKNTSRQKKVLLLQKELVDTREETFLQQIDLLLSRQQEEINKLKNIIQTDEELVAIRSEVAKAATSRLENEVITTSEYIREVQSETIAKLEHEMHKIQLSEALEKYTLIKGKDNRQTP